MRILAAAAALVTSACCTSLPRLAPKRVELPRREAAFDAVTESRETLHDAKRQRDVPITIYRPERAGGKIPVVVFSHGIGEDRDSYAWMGRALARAGFLAVHVTHAGSDRAVLERGYIHLYRAVKQKENWVNRPLDVSFVLDQLEKRGDADLDRVAVAGHSAGAFTAFAVAGMRPSGGESLRDPRVKVAIAMSMPRMDGVVAPGGYDPIAIPLLNLTGTCDTSIIYRTFPRHRRIPFDSTKAARQYLVTISRATHDSFVIEDARRDAILQIVLGFLDAWMNDDAKARAWFDDAGRGEAAGIPVSVERKP